MTTEMVKARIEKLTAQLDRINKALETGKNPYYYDESNRSRTTADLERAKEDLKKTEAKDQLTAQLEAGKIDIIENFLDIWEAKTIEYYKRRVESYRNFMEEHKDEDRKTREETRREAIATFGLTTIAYARHEADPVKDAREEKKAKREMFYFRIKEITGRITDARGLRIGDNGEINGIVYGEIANAKINTISAGGWNIQCFHFRVLVTKI